MSMTVAEARTEIKAHFERAKAIEDKYAGKEMPGEDLQEVKRLLTEIDGLESKLAVIEDSEERRQRILGGLDRYSQPVPHIYNRGAQVAEMDEARRTSPGEQFIKSREYLQMKQDGLFNSPLNRVQFGVQLKDGTSLIQWKTLLYGSGTTSGGPFIQNDLQPGYVEYRQRNVQLLDLIPRYQTASDTVEFVRQTAIATSAAWVAEATNTTGTSGLKPESALAFETVTETVRTLAHWIPVTNRMLADSPAIAGIINGQLLIGLSLKLEDAVIGGNGSGETPTGMLADASVQVQGIGTDSVLDAIYKARTKVMIAHGRPSAVVLHPNDWEAIRLSRENAATGTLGNYLMGPPSQVGAVTLWGMPVVETQGITVNTALVGDFMQAVALFDREQAAVRVGTIDDQFVRNMQTILAELRAAFVIWRPTLLCKVTGI